MLNDHEELSERATIVIESNDVFFLHEVVVENVYILGKVYGAQNNEVSAVRSDLLEREKTSARY